MRLRSVIAQFKVSSIRRHRVGVKGAHDQNIGRYAAIAAIAAQIAPKNDIPTCYRRRSRLQTIQRGLSGLRGVQVVDDTGCELRTAQRVVAGSFCRLQMQAGYGFVVVRNVRNGRASCVFRNAGCRSSMGRLTGRSIKQLAKEILCSVMFDMRWKREWRGSIIYNLGCRRKITV